MSGTTPTTETLSYCMYMDASISTRPDDYKPVKALPSHLDSLLAKLVTVPPAQARRVSVEDLMNLKDDGVYGNGGIERVDGVVDGSKGFFLIYSFIGAMIRGENPNMFAVPVLEYICSKDPEVINMYNNNNNTLHSNEIDVKSCRFYLVNYIYDQENGGLTEINRAKFYHSVKNAIYKWIPYLIPELYEIPKDEVTIENVQPVIKECYTTLVTRSKEEDFLPALVRVHTELGLLSLEHEDHFGTKLSKFCDLLLDFIRKCRNHDLDYDVQKIRGFEEIANTLSRLVYVPN